MTNKELREMKQRNKRERKKTYREWLAAQSPAVARYKQKVKERREEKMYKEGNLSLRRVKEYESKFC